MNAERLRMAASVQIDFHLMDSFAHAGQCQNVNCQRQCCSHLMQVATHARSCAVNKRENHVSCYLCRQVLALCAIHLENCQNPQCFIPFCARYKTYTIIPKESNQTNPNEEKNGIRVSTPPLTKTEIINFYKFRKIVHNKYKRTIEKYPVTDRECYQ